MAMVFTLVSAAQEKLNEFMNKLKEDKESDKLRKEKEAEEADRKKFVGTAVTLETLEQRLAASHLYSPDASPSTFRSDKLLPLNRFPPMTLTHETDGNGSPDT